MAKIRRQGRVLGEARIVFEPRDLWVGVYWTRAGSIVKLYVCLIPCLPLCVWWWSKEARAHD